MRTVQSILVTKKLLGLAGMTFGLLHASYSLRTRRPEICLLLVGQQGIVCPNGNCCKTDFLCNLVTLYCHAILQGAKEVHRGNVPVENNANRYLFHKAIKWPIVYSFERQKSLYSPDLKTRSWQPSEPPLWGSFCNANFSKETKRLVKPVCICS